MRCLGCGALSTRHAYYANKSCVWLSGSGFAKPWPPLHPLAVLHLREPPMIKAKNPTTKQTQHRQRDKPISTKHNTTHPSSSIPHIIERINIHAVCMITCAHPILQRIKHRWNRLGIEELNSITKTTIQPRQKPPERPRPMNEHGNKHSNENHRRGG